MTLAEALEKHGKTLHPTAPGTLVMDGQGISDFFHLTDFKVSTVSCGNPL